MGFLLIQHARVCQAAEDMRVQEGVLALGLATSVQLAAFQLRSDSASVQPTTTIPVSGQIAALSLSSGAGSQVIHDALLAAAAWLTCAVERVFVTSSLR